MQLLDDVVGALTSVQTATMINPKALRPTSEPSWAVTYNGAIREGQGWRDTLTVHVFAGPAYSPKIEGSIWRAGADILAALWPLNVLLGDLIRQPDQTIQRSEMPFAHLTIDVQEVGDEDEQQLHSQ